MYKGKAKKEKGGGNVKRSRASRVSFPGSVVCEMVQEKGNFFAPGGGGAFHSIELSKSAKVGGRGGCIPLVRTGGSKQ